MEVDTKAHAEREEEKRIEAMYEYASRMEAMEWEVDGRAGEIRDMIESFQSKVMDRVQLMGERVEEVTTSEVSTDDYVDTDEFVRGVRVLLEILDERVGKYATEVSRLAKQAGDDAYDQDWHGPLD